MPVSVTMPRLGESVSEGTVTRWLKKEGDRVEADEPLLEVSTDKVDTEIPAPASGVLAAIKVAEDETVEVGVELATIDEGGQATGDAPAEPAQQPEAPQQEAPQEQTSQHESPQQESPPEPVPAGGDEQAEQEPAAREQAPAPQPEAAPEEQRGAQVLPMQPQLARPRPAEAAEEDQGAYVTPLVRKLAAEHRVDLGAVQGTGVGGRIRKQDVLDAARAVAPPAEEQPVAGATAPGTPAAVTPPVSPLRGRTEKMSRLRAVIAQRMVESLRVSAQLTTVAEIDVTRIARLRAQVKDDFAAREGVRLSFLPFFAVAAVEALKAHPKLNSSIDSEAGTVTYYDAEHLGVAVDTDRGLLVPVIRDAGDLNIAGMARKITDLAARTRENKVGPDELGGGTFTLTNTGSRGALFDTPIINQPQVGILGTGAVVKRAAVVDDPDLGEVIAVRSMVYLALSYDHRIVDGADAARFLLTVKERLEAGAFEAQLGL